MTKSRRTPLTPDLCPPPRSNNLTDLPEDLADFFYLRLLRLKYNQLKKLPGVIASFRQLMVLELSGNQINKLDDFVAHLPHCREVDLSGNQLTAIPEAMCEMHSLQMLQLENNRIEQLPENMGDMQSLIKLDLSTNSLRTLPQSMGRLKKIQRIDCANNLLVRVPPSMGDLKTLKELNLRYNNLDEQYRAKVEEGLSKFLAFLREEGERERLAEIERLKPIGTQVGAYLEYRCKAETEQIVKTEGGQRVVDNRCWTRTGHTLTQVGNTLFVFGGASMKDGTKTNDLFWISTDRMDWHNQVTQGQAPCPRDGHCTVHDEESNRLMVFGGCNQERKRLNDCFYLDLETFTWGKVPNDGTGPIPREQSSAVYWQGNMIVFGGRSSGSRLNDLYVLDLHSWQWSQPATSGTAPAPRQSAALCIGNGNQMFVQGGRNNFVLEDLFMLDLMSKTWSEVPTGGRAPPPRHSHCMAVHKEFLHVFGGYDELGAHAVAMHRLPVPYGENLPAMRPEWEEWESQLVFNKCRTYDLEGGRIISIQLSKMNEEDAEKGAVSWDVLRVAELEKLKAKELDEEDLRPKNAKRQRIQHTMTVASKLPRAYTSVSRKEARMADHLKEFQRVFCQLYPHRRPLYFMPKNECGTPKFVSTTLRPSKLPFTELYELDGILGFVADFLQYEPLEDPLHPPAHLASQMSVLQWHAGDSFDIATVLCSLLLGVGYDAYVVAGYAPRSVVLNDQTNVEYPLSESDLKAAAVVAGVASADPAAAPKSDSKTGSKYAIKPPREIESQFIKEQEEAQRVEAESEARASREKEAAQKKELLESMMGDEDPDEHHGKYVHAWVMVMAGNREVAESMFVEPSTGRKYSVEDSPYEGIEFMWNHRNFWVCMQMPEPHSDSRAHPKTMSYNLADPSKWEFVLSENLPEAMLPGEPGKESKDAAGATPLSSRPLLNSAAVFASDQPAKLEALEHVQRHLMGGDTPLRTTSAASGVSGLDSGAPEDNAKEDKSDALVDMPPSWVPKLTIGRDVFDMRCPRGQKSTAYRKCQHEIFALFGECSRWDGMVERLTRFEDEDRTVVVEMMELFRRRKDSLRERRVYPQKETSIEYFNPSSSFGLKQLLVVKGEKHIMHFYHTARLDGLVCREEYLQRKMIETYTGRDDRLVYRSVTYSQASPDAERQQDHKPAGVKRKQENLIPIVKMTEKFSRNPDVPADEDVAKRVFYRSQDMIKIEFHYAKNKITNSSRIFHKDGHSNIVQVDPLAKRLQAGFLLDEYQELLLAEKECMQSARDSEWEVKEVFRVRTNQEQNITLTMPYYDIVRIKAEESDEEEEEEKEAENDHLSPFMPPLIGEQMLTKEQALEVREKCLKALKERLIERANIIQARHDEEAAALSKRQANYQRDRDQMTREEEEEYEKACEESLFRTHILEKRLKRHEEQALQKYFDLDQKLRHDPRLASLLQS
eukprot:evm.model.scf_58.17 EVM.evm.TU.scf_58.17   scf_58:148652-165934(+)